MLLILINIFRMQHNVAPIYLNTATCAFAQTRLVEVEQNFSHAGFYARVPELRREAYRWDENLAKNFPTPISVLYGWENSPTHRANLLDTSTYGCVASDGKYWVLEMEYHPYK